MSTGTVLLATSIGILVGWVAHTLLCEPYGKDHEQRLIDAYSQGWRACENFLAKDMIDARDQTPDMSA
ncbi:MAG: hypothetical protein KTR25_12605 [Myxococcales bacterium]|nr:hypothetical protein [Myxococcales bacterium]